MPDLSNLVPLHLGQVRNLFLLVLGQVHRKLIQFYNTSINDYKLTCCLFRPLSPLSETYMYDGKQCGS